MPRASPHRSESQHRASLSSNARSAIRAAVINGAISACFVTKGVHPGAIAISNSLGHWAYTSVARAERERDVGTAEAGMDRKGLRDADWERNMWWQDDSNADRSKWQKNTGGGWAQNKVLAIAPDFISGQQSFHDTVVKVRKLT